MTDATAAPPAYLAAWLAFLASPAAPKQPMPALELDGYLTGVVVAPSPVPSIRWLLGLWGDEELDIEAFVAARPLLGSVVGMAGQLTATIERSLRRLESEHACSYRPAFLTAEDKPSHDAVRGWVHGFWKAMQLAPSEWSGLVADERTRVLVAPFIGFIDLDRDEAFEPAEDINERLDEAAATIPRAILLLRKLANIRAARPKPSTPEPVRWDKVGRNEPCPCGSGKKFKRCCGQP